MAPTIEPNWPLLNTYRRVLMSNCTFESNSTGIPCDSDLITNIHSSSLMDYEMEQATHNGTITIGQQLSNEPYPILSNGNGIGSDYDSNHFYIKRPHDMLHPSEINPAFLPIIITHTLTFLVGVIGNCVVIATWSLHGRFRSPTAVFLVSLAIADLLLLLVLVPLETLEYFMITWGGLSSICKTIAYVEVISAMSTVLNLVAVSIERFLVIVYPMRARSWCTMSSTRKGLIIIWGLALVLSTPVLLTKHTSQITYYNETTSLTLYYCFDVENDLTFMVSIYQLLVMFILPALFMVVCYYVVIRQLWVSTRSVNEMTRAENQMYSQRINLPSTNNAQIEVNFIEIHEPDESNHSKTFNWCRLWRWYRKSSSRDINNIENNNNNNNEHHQPIQWQGSDESNMMGNDSGRQQHKCCWNLCHLSKNRSTSAVDELSECTMSSSYQMTSYVDNTISPRTATFNAESFENLNQKYSSECEQDYKLANTRRSVGVDNCNNPIIHQPQIIRTMPSSVMEITRSRIQVIKMLVLIVLIFLCCWGPRLIMNIVVKSGLLSYSSVMYNTRIVCNLLSFVHSALNPFVYGFMSSNFRAMVCSSFRRRGTLARARGSAQINRKRFRERMESDTLTRNVVVNDLTTRY